ncbi:hypothetical protein zly1402F_01180 [Mycoplasma capricolum subsp. capripneumoniae]|nr:hypothetical protein [Mycoplasma capricolum]UVO24976.1 hypothetical protein zly1402F_01180 [Mycoplasma capricolum subsp. capripneumoniae]
MNKLLLTLSLANLFSFPTNLILRSENSSLTNKRSINSRYFDFPNKYLETSTRYEEKDFSTEINITNGPKIWFPTIKNEEDLKNAQWRDFDYDREKSSNWTKYYYGFKKILKTRSYYDGIRNIPPNISKYAEIIQGFVDKNWNNHLNKNDVYEMKIELVAGNYKMTRNPHGYSNGYPRAFYLSVDDDSRLTKIRIYAKLRTKITKSDQRRKYQSSWYKWRNYLQNKSFITIDSDTGGNLKTELVGNQMSDGFKTNKQFLEDKITEFNSKNRNDLTLQYEITSSNTISLYLKGDNFREKLADEIKIYFQTTDKFQTQELESRLNITLRKWVDFNTHATRLVDDVLVKDDKVKIVNSGTTRNAGRWITHAPLKVSFNALKDETEVLKINGQRVDVLNQRFETNLNDNRKNSSDNEREFNHGYQPKENKKKDEKNSHLKNEYNIEITKYKPKTGNKDIEYTWTKTLVIESRSSEMDFKWYAWDPKTYAHQRELIEEFQKDEKGKTKRDKTGKPIKNPKYDPKIDPNTGTKKELIWFDFNTHNPWIINSIYGDEKKYYE